MPYCRLIHLINNIIAMRLYFCYVWYRENHKLFICSSLVYVLFSIDLKKNIFWKLVYFFRVFFITVPNSKVSLLTLIKLFRRLKLYSVSVCDEPCSPDRTYTHVHTSQKCQDNNMKKNIQKPLRGRLIPALFSDRGYTIDQAWE